MINQLIPKKRLSGKLKTTRRLPTYDMQGDYCFSYFVYSLENCLYAYIYNYMCVRTIMSFLIIDFLTGREFRALFLSTSEQTHSDASSRNPTKSFSNPQIFNTAVTRAQSLVVAIGSPFLLLKTEQTMKKYGTKGEVWSNFLKRCLKQKQHGSFIIHPSLNVTKKKAKAIRLLLEDQLEDEAVPDGTSNDAAGMNNESYNPLQLHPPPQGELL